MRVVITYIVIILGAIGALVHALLTDPAAATVLTPTVNATLGLIGVIVTALLPAIQSLGKASSTPKLPPLPVLLVLLVVGLAACANLTPSKLQNIENTVDVVALDACIMAADFAPETDAQTVAEVCDVVQKGLPIAEDVANFIVQELAAKKRAADPALKAKYAAKLAARKP